METSPNDQLDAVRKALGEPFGAEFRDKVWKIRTNLLAVSLISLFVAFAKLSVAPGSTVFGLQLSALGVASLPLNSRSYGTFSTRKKICRHLFLTVSIYSRLDSATPGNSSIHRQA